MGGKNPALGSTSQGAGCFLKTLSYTDVKVRDNAWANYDFCQVWENLWGFAYFIDDDEKWDIVW